MTQVITSESPLVRASTPKEIAITPDVAANVIAARQGLAWVAVPVAIGTYRARLGLPLETSSHCRPRTRRAFVRYTGSSTSAGRCRAETAQRPCEGGPSPVE